MSATTLLCFLTLLIAITYCYGQGVKIDCFDVRQPRTFVNSADGMGMSIVRDDDIFAGERNVTAIFESGPSSFEGVSCVLSQGMFAINCDNLITGGCVASYTAPNSEDISPPRDLSACGGWYSFLDFADNPVNVEITAHTPMGSLSSRQTFQPVEAPGTILWLPFVEPRSAYMAVQRIDFSLLGGPDLDSSVSQICCAPPVACWHNFTMETRNSSRILPGDSVRATITCQNFGAPPTKTESEDIHMRFTAPFFGEILSQSVQCTKSNMAFVSNNMFTNSVTLDVDEIEECSFVIFLTENGTAPLQFTIIAGDSTSLSHEITNRAGTPDLCLPAVPTLFTVESPIVGQEICPPYNFTEGVNGTWRLINEPSGSAAPPVYCLRFDELLPGMEPVTFGCEGREAFISFDGTNGRIRIFGTVTGGLDSGDTWDNPEDLTIDVWYSEITHITLPGDRFGVQGRRGTGVLRYRGETLSLRGVGSPALEIVEIESNGMDVAALEGWLVTTNGTALGTERGDFLGRIGECITDEFNSTAIF